MASSKEKMVFVKEALLDDLNTEHSKEDLSRGSQFVWQF
jgi:hypothetical protein